MTNDAAAKRETADEANQPMADRNDDGLIDGQRLVSAIIETSFRLRCEWWL